MFKNKPSEELEKFLSLMGIDVEKLNKKNPEDHSVYSQWKLIKVQWHIASYQTSEQHRRFIGNDLSVIVFVDEDIKQLDISMFDKLGIISQNFVAVQPYDSKYKLGFFHKKEIQLYDPPIPTNYLFEECDIRDFILVKVYNGLMMTFYSPPMSRLFIEPRKAAIQELIRKYKNRNWIKKKIKKVKKSN